MSAAISLNKNSPFLFVYRLAVTWAGLNSLADKRLKRKMNKSRELSGDIIAVVTLQAFTRGKSFYLGKISLGKFTSGFIFPWLKRHTGDHWSLGGLTSQRIKF